MRSVGQNTSNVNGWAFPHVIGDLLVMLKRAFQLLALVSLAAAGSCKDSTRPTDPTTLQYDVEVRFFSASSMSPSQQALFTNAAARISQIVKGDIIAAARPSQAVNLNDCPNVTEDIMIQEQIDDVIIYASIRSIDGSGGILASAGPCFTRPTSTGAMTAIGVMSFDSADLNTLSQGGNLQDVITHEMLHVLGIGTLWASHGLIADTATASPRYLGAQARAGCVAVGGSVACANHVPVEGTPASVGTRDAHWRENTFNQEMMTGFLDANTPISAITLGALKDLGFTVDDSQADAFSMPPTGFLPRVISMSAQYGPNWEHLTTPVGSIEGGRVVLLPRK